MRMANSSCGHECSFFLLKCLLIKTKDQTTSKDISIWSSCIVFLSKIMSIFLNKPHSPHENSTIKTSLNEHSNTTYNSKKNHKKSNIVIHIREN